MKYEEFIETEEQPKDKRKKIAKQIIFIVCLILICVIVAYIMSRVMFVTIKVDGESMYPTLKDEDMMLLYKIGKYKHGDVVVFESGIFNSYGRERIFVKRIIGLPGDTIEIKESPDGSYNVYRNGEKLVEDYITHQFTSPYMPGPVVVEEGKFYYLGDNRNNSNDSEDGNWGELSKIIGRVIIRYHGDNFFNDTSIIPRVKSTKSMQLISPYLPNRKLLPVNLIS
ncbi:MAG TPA: signal peptidase I [Clostridia bacterium]|jgi:signal peptidase I|nr:signal peptidase I [Clostridia bacterium]